MNQNWRQNYYKFPQKYMDSKFIPDMWKMMGAYVGLPADNVHT